MASDSADNGVPNSDSAPEELGVMLDDLLGDLSNKFNAMASELTAKMDDMSRRIDNLEASMRAGQTKEGEGEGSGKTSP